MARKLLMIAFSYPPLNSVAAVRPAKFAKYLPEFGWEPIVITRQWGEQGLEDESGMRVVRTKHKKLQPLLPQKNVAASKSNSQSAQALDKQSFAWKVRNFVRYWLREFPDGNKGWLPYALEAARQVIQEEEIELIFSTIHPFTSHMIADRLQRETGIPWVADFRDPWSQSPVKKTYPFREFGETIMEKRILRSAALITTVTPPWAEGLQQLHNKPAVVVRNGFDDQDYAKPAPPLTKTFTITYTGRALTHVLARQDFKGNSRDVSGLFSALKMLLETGQIDAKLFSLRFYGPETEAPILNSFAKQYGIESIFFHGGKVSYQEAIERQRESTALLLLNWSSKEHTFKENGWVPAKAYEYFGAQRPIIAVPKHVGVDELLLDTKSGVSATSKDEIAAVIKAWYDEFLATGNIAHRGVEQVVKQYTRRAQTQKLAAAFDSVIQGKPGLS